jgi:1,4-alpha-glucan branching enzyme
MTKVVKLKMRRGKRISTRNILTGDIVAQKGIDRILRFEEAEPFEFLGPHQVDSGWVVRAFLPRAVQAWVVKEGKRQKEIPMVKSRDDGMFELYFQNVEELFSYHIRTVNIDDEEKVFQDPYAFPTDISDFDLHLFSEGNHFKIYEKLGAHCRTIRQTEGVHFAVWAPHAKSVSVVGDFNYWRSGTHPMTQVRFSGVWALFVPGLEEGTLFKYAIRGADNEVRMKTDPFGQETELRPRTAVRVTRLRDFEWTDAPWLKERDNQNPLERPVSIYEVHLGSWRRDGKKDWGFLSYQDLAHDLVSYVKEMGYTHIELMPVMEHPLDESWGYQVVNFFAPTSRFGKPKDFMYFINYCHENGIGVILDWVPGHFPTDPHGLANFDGNEIFAYESWKKREHKDWGTFVFDYGRNEVRNFLISNALFWMERYHIDGLRVDAVASMLYLDYSRESGEWESNQYGGNQNLEFVDFIRKLNEQLYQKFPGMVMIAEESTAWAGVSRPTFLGGLGFGMKWNMGWMHDTLQYFSRDPVYRRWDQGMLTFSLIYAFSENFMLPISHDEVVHGKKSLLEKMPGDDWQKFANLRLLLGFMYAHPGKKLLFMGCEFGQRAEWNCLKSLDWHLLGYDAHAQVQTWVKQLNQFYRNSPELYEQDFDGSGFEWIDFSDYESSVISFIRWSRDRKSFLIAVCNMTPIVRHSYRIGVPEPGCYEEMLNSDALEFGGSGVRNNGKAQSESTYWQNRKHSISATLPPLAIVVLRLAQPARKQI